MFASMITCVCARAALRTRAYQRLGDGAKQSQSDVRQRRFRLAPYLRVALVAFIATDMGKCFSASYPERPMRIIVALPPGGGVDIVARIIGQELAETLGQQVVIDNRPGAAGTLGTNLAAKASPDGYTMLFGSVGPLTSSPSLVKDLPYDPTKDFAPVSLLASFPNVLLVNPASPLKSVNEIIIRARSTSGQLIYASSGVGTPPHLAMELFKAMVQVKITHVPYKGGPPALNDLLGGRVDLMFINILTATPFVTSGKLSALAVTTLSRSPVLPNVPTMAEAGELSGFSVQEWVGMLLPARTPIEVVNKLNAEVIKILAATRTSRKLIALGAEPITCTPVEFASFIKAEIIKWRTVIRDAGILPE